MTTNKRNMNNVLDTKYGISLLKNNWKIFAASVLVCFSFAFLKTRFSLPVYQISASILISGGDNGYAQEVSQFLEGFGGFSGEKNFQNELQILQSKSLIKETVNQLNQQITYYQKKFMRDEELYQASPFVVVFDHNLPQPVNVPIKIEIIDTTSFEINIDSKSVDMYIFNNGTVTQTLPELDFKENGSFNDTISHSNYYNFRLILNRNFEAKDFQNKKFIFVINTPESITKMYKASLEVEPDDIQSTVAVLNMKSTVPQKAIDFINSLAEVYMIKDLERRIHMSDKTIEYIDNQIRIIKDSLTIAEANLQRFRRTNQVMDIASKSGRINDKLNELENEKAAASIKSKYYQYINDYFQQNRELSDLIAPSAMGIEDPLLNNMIQELIKLNSEKTSLIENNQEKSPYLKKLNIQIDNLKNTISENIKYVINTTHISLQDIDSRYNELTGEINKLPQTERELFGMEREFNLNDALYTFLLQKRAEAQIAKASYLPDAVIIEPADRIGFGPISPKKKLNYLLGLFSGFLIPFLFFYLKDVLNDKIKDREDLESVVNHPILGQVFRNNKKTELVVSVFPKSHIAESFRMIRSNLNYFLTKSENKTIVLSSTYSEEGKSFIALNLAAALALTNQKVILLGFDLRKPKIYEKLGLKEQAGISAYLSKQAELGKIIQKSNLDNLDVIIAGEVPPNPSELITSGMTEELIRFLKEKYYYIVIDTAPIGLLSDASCLMDLAGLNIYVVRQEYTNKKEMLSVLNELEQRKTSNICFVLNDVPLLKKSKYGYDYYDEGASRHV